MTQLLQRYPWEFLDKIENRIERVSSRYQGMIQELADSRAVYQWFVSSSPTLLILNEKRLGDLQKVKWIQNPVESIPDHVAILAQFHNKDKAHPWYSGRICLFTLNGKCIYSHYDPKENTWCENPIETFERIETLTNYTMLLKSMYSHAHYVHQHLTSHYAPIKRNFGQGKKDIKLLELLTAKIAYKVTALELLETDEIVDTGFDEQGQFVFLVLR